MKTPTQFTWTRISGQYYQVLAAEGDKVLVLHHSATGPGPINVALNGPPLLVEGMYWADKALCTFFPQEPIEHLPAIPFAEGLQIGSRVKWGTSLAEWAVVRLEGDRATIRQVSGWAAAMDFEAPVTELVDLRPVKGSERLAA